MQRGDEVAFLESDVAGIVHGHGSLDVVAGCRVVRGRTLEVGARSGQVARLHMGDAAVDEHRRAMLLVVADPGDAAVEPGDRLHEIAALEREKPQLAVQHRRGLRPQVRTPQCFVAELLRRGRVTLPDHHCRERSGDARPQISIVCALRSQRQYAARGGVLTGVEMGTPAPVELSSGKGHLHSMPRERLTS